MLDLASLLRPTSVAVVGANDGGDTFGGRIWHYLSKYSQVERMAVNTRPDALEGAPVAPRLSELPTAPQVVVLATPAGTVRDLVAASAEVGARALVVLSQVPAEERPEIAAMVAKAGMTVLGPGSLGLINANDSVVLSSSVSLELGTRRGPLALVAQSGALMGVLHARAMEQGVGLGLCVATGSQLQVRVEHFLAALSDDDDYLAVGAHIEDIDIALFTAAAESFARAGRKLVVLKGGLTAPGGIAAAGHSGALMGDGSAFRALARELGVLVVEQPAELLDCLQAYTISGKSWYFATVSGGLAAITADLAAESGLELPLPDPGLGVFPPSHEMHGHDNPLDLDAVPMTNGQIVKAIKQLLADETADGVVVVLNDKPGLEFLVSSLSGLDGRERSRLQLCSECSGQYEHVWRVWTERGGAYTKGISSLIHALAATRELPTQQVDREPDGRLIPAVCAQEKLSAAGIPVLPLVEIRHAEDLDETISQLELPLVLKVADEEHRHTEDVVIVASRQEAYEAFDRLAKRGDVVAQALAKPGLEFYIGINHDSVCGPVFMIGAGGPTLEAQRDVAMTIGFPDRRRVKACLAETGCGRWVLGSLGSRLIDTELLVDIALKAVTVARDMSESFAALDLNPVVIGPWGVTVIDAKLHVRSGTPDHRSGLPCTP